MRKVLIAASLAGALFATSVQATLTATVTSGPVGGGNNGGEFTAASSWNGTFVTFCIERNEFFNPGTTYDVVLNSKAVAGGIGGGVPDPLSVGTAWLFSQFAAGTLKDSFNVLYGSVNHAADAGDLQIAFWMLEQEITQGDGTGLWNPNNRYLLAIPVGLGNPMADAAVGQFGVQAMNLYTLGQAGNLNALHQDLLTVPEPTTMIAGALLLLPFGASTLRLLRRRA